MPSTAATIREMYELLFRHFGPQGWWPGRTPTEVMVGAVLTQNTNWRNVAKAIANLRAAGLLDVDLLAGVPLEGLAALIRPAGYYNVKAKRLKNLVHLIHRDYGGDLQALFDLPADRLREELLGVSGIGRETADSIILYAACKPTFVVDAYTARIGRRHFLIDDTADYEQIKDLFESALPADTQLFNEYHALLVACGKGYCRPVARCQECPLYPLEHDGTVR